MRRASTIAALTLLTAPPVWAARRLAVYELTGSTLQPEDLLLLNDGLRGPMVAQLPAYVPGLTQADMEVMPTDMGLGASCISEVETARSVGSAVLGVRYVFRKGSRTVPFGALAGRLADARVRTALLGPAVEYPRWR